MGTLFDEVRPFDIEMDHQESQEANQKKSHQHKETLYNGATDLQIL